MDIKLKDVTKIYKLGEIKTYALKDVSLEIKSGEIVVILGHSGSGKSTLLNVISGLDTPTSGKILVGSHTISEYNSNQLTNFRRENLGFIFQQYNLLQNLTVRENIEIGSRLGETPFDIDDILGKVGLENEKYKYPYQLSGGQQQRVSIARSISKNPQILFCDEPTGALDEKTSKQVLDLLWDINRELKTTIVIITHNPNIAVMADRVIKMNSGQIQDIKLNRIKMKVSDIVWRKYVK